MTQAWALLCAIFNPLGGLVVVLRVVLGYLCDLDDALRDPDMRRTPESLRAIETGIVFAEHWIAILIAARTSELLGKRFRIDSRWAGWTPARARSHQSLRQRHARARASLRTIERFAMRRAARIRRLIAANPLGLAASPVDMFARIVARPVLMAARVVIAPMLAACTARIRAPP